MGRRHIVFTTLGRSPRLEGKPPEQPPVEPPPSPPPPQPPPPPSVGGAWAWDASAATVTANSAEVIPIFLQHGGPFGYFFAEVGVGVIEPGDPTYAVNSSGKQGGPFDPTIYFPDGVQPGVSNDHHLAVIDTVRQRWHDFELYGSPLPARYFTGGKVVGWTGGCSMPIGATQEPRSSVSHSGATAAKFPLLQGLVTPDEVKAGVISHALAFSATNIGPAPNPFPANSPSGYTGPNVPMQQAQWQLMPALGTWLRLSPSADLATVHGFEHVLAVALQRYGMFCRDRGTDFAIQGMDAGGGGSSFAAWRSVGVQIGANGAVRFSAAFVALLQHLQVVHPPA